MTERHVLVRWLTDGLNEAGGALFPEMLRRDVTFRTRKGDAATGIIDEAVDLTLPGIVLVGNDEHEPLARRVGAVVFKIMRTDELLWLPVNARREFGAWSVEAVPLIDWMHVVSRTDDAILAASNIDPATGQYQ